MGRFQYFIKLVIFFIITFYVLQVTTSLWCLKLFLKKCREIGSFSGTHRERSAVRHVFSLERYHSSAHVGSIGIPVQKYHYLRAHISGEYINYRRWRDGLPQ